MRFAISILLLFIVCACNNNANQKEENDSVRLRELEADSVVTVEEINKENYFVWQVDNENKTKSLNPNLKEEYLQVDTLITGLNEMFPKIRLEKTKLSHDTLYTRIQDSDYLTEQMGSSGSELYIAQAVINLTTIPGINFVRIDFEVGSHASPDVWSKDSFKEYKEVQ